MSGEDRLIFAPPEKTLEVMFDSRAPRPGFFPSIMLRQENAMSNEYVNPQVLVSTDWVAQHMNDPKVRIVESDEDVLLYDIGHCRAR